MKLLLAVIGLATAITWALKQYNSPQRRKERLIRQIIDKEYELRDAVAKKDANRASIVSTELDRLRREASLYPD